MNNFNKLIDYINILHAKINLLLSDGGNISVLASIFGIIFIAWFITRRIRKHFLQQKFPLSLFSNIIAPSIVYAALSIINLAYLIKHSSSNYLISFFSWLALAMLCIRAINGILSHLFASKSYIQSLTKIIQLSLWLCALVMITDSNNDIIVLLDSITFHLSKTNEISIWDILHAIATIIIAIVIAMLTNQFIERKISNVQNIDNNLQQIFIRLSKILIFIVGLLITLPMVGIDITALSVLGGAIGVGIGFGLQKIASNFLSGFIILFDRSIKVGDRLIIDNNAGLVEKITMRYVVMERFDGTEVLIPNEMFITNSIQNQSYSNTSLRAEISCNIGSGNDIMQAIELITQIIKNEPNTLNDKVSVNITRLIDDGVEVKGYFWVENPSLISGVSNSIYVKIVELFKQQAITLPATSQRIELIKNG
ncbi:MAG: mechanosensitive ion channel [Burkholderiales bacterium]|nr:mechanosensitive ion channel [Burkholderiales bacterium]MBP9768041.1 mechanosensitive ion channel [Burkholderiales bacterium]